ncbi:VacJ family lipoprotein [Candidatus Pelagibacter sp.]|nr:VacJ family lipoprotein [Candidatus Pelagibacter sp.]
MSLFLVTFNVNAGSDGELVMKKNQPAKVKDCFEPINRATFAFNQGLDKIVFKPVAKAYRVLPSPIRVGTSNALENLSSLITIPNNILQGEFNKAGVNTTRFFINTTFGIAGIFDVAEIMGFQEYEKEDYGQTLGTLGVGPGCYLVLPVIGPSTVRDTVGSLANIVGGDPWYNITVANNTEHFSDFDYWITRVTAGIDFRAKNLDSFDNLEKNSLDFYASIRSLYLQDRQMKIANSSAITDTMNDSDWEEIETK